MKFSLALPREALSIPVVRRVVGDALRGLGVSEDCVSDILVATSEACTNVVQHARNSTDYEVVGHVAGGVCLLRILDWGRGSRQASDPSSGAGSPSDTSSSFDASGSFDGPGRRDESGPFEGPGPFDEPGPFDASGPFDAPAPFDASGGPFDPGTLRESGRGLRIMRALVDELSIESAPDRGTVVQMHKRLTWRDEALIRRLEHRLARSAG
ncbi:ATP-binding protein [Spirillospora sp. NPDC052269]